MNKQEIFMSDAIDVIDEVLGSGGEFRLYPKGTSMLPLIREGRDSVMLKRNSDCSVKKHDIVLYKRKNEAFVLHRILKIEKDGSYVMCGDNQDRLERNINKEQLYGYVSGIFRDDKYSAVSSWAYRIYVALWCFMPLRRICFLGRRVFKGIKRRIIKK